jgi:hypothetical protein
MLHRRINATYYIAATGMSYPESMCGHHHATKVRALHCADAWNLAQYRGAFGERHAFEVRRKRDPDNKGDVLVTYRMCHFGLA